MASDIRCPICGSETRLRTSKKDGSKFHVCVNYPECKGKVAFESEWDDWDEEKPVGQSTYRTAQQQRKLKPPKPSRPEKPVKWGGNSKSPSSTSIGCLVGVIVILLVVIALPLSCALGLFSSISTDNHGSSSGSSSVSIGDTRSNPVPLGQSKQYGSQELTVLDAWEEPAGGLASSDDKSLYATVRIRFLQSASSTGYVSSSDFRSVGTLGIIRSMWDATSSRSGIVFGEYFGGSTAEGNICGHVDKSDSNFILIWSCGLGKSLYFSLTTD